MLGPSLYQELIKPNKRIDIRDLQKILRDLLICLKFLKDIGIIHCDIKPENILFRQNDFRSVKVIDFGSAIFANDTGYDYIQTRPYRAPEIILGCHFDFAVDMWSVGCVLYEIITFKVLFNYKTVQENLAKAMSISDFLGLDLFASTSTKPKKPFVIGNLLRVGDSGDFNIVVSKGEYKIENDLRECDCDEALIDFIKRCLVFDPAGRLKVEDALNHEFLKKTFV